MGIAGQLDRGRAVTGYGIHDVQSVAYLVTAISLIPLVGFGVARIPGLTVACMAAWSLVVAAVLGIERYSADEPAGTRMLFITVGLLWSMKTIVYVESQHQGRRVNLTFGQWIAFCVGSLGMRAEAFKTVPSAAKPDWQRFLTRGCVRIVAGGALLAAAWGAANLGNDSPAELGGWRRWPATALLLPGLSLVLHFGCLNILTGFWRYFGASCTALFRAPLRSQSLSEFWGRRWNLAFSEMTVLAVYRPLKQLPGASGKVSALATFGGFLFSGLLHELAISVPVGAGYGLPLLYFILHGIGMLLERRLPFLRSALAGRVWTAAWVLLPLPILFHRPFLEGCIWPLIGM